MKPLSIFRKKAHRTAGLPSAVSHQPPARPFRRRFAGFTLVELLVVITIIAILISMLTAALVGARNHARQARAQAQLRELVKAWTQYYMTYEQWPDPTWTSAQDVEMTPDNLKWLLQKDSVQNTRGITFLTVKTGNSVDAGQNYLDPWGHTFRISFSSKKVSDTTAMRISVGIPNRDRYRN